MVKINNQPILWYIIKNLIKNSFNHLVTVGYKGNIIKNYKKHRFLKKNIEIVDTGNDTKIAKRIFFIKIELFLNFFVNEW